MKVDTDCLNYILVTIPIQLDRCPIQRQDNQKDNVDVINNMAIARSRLTQ